MKQILLPLLVVLLSSSVQSTNQLVNWSDSEYCRVQADSIGCYPNSVDKDVLQANFAYLRQGYETIFDYYKRNERYFKTENSEADRRFAYFSLSCIDHAINTGVFGKKVYSAFDEFDKIKLFLAKHKNSPASDIEMHFFVENYFKLTSQLLAIATDFTDITDVASGDKNVDWRSICSPPVRWVDTNQAVYYQ